MVLTLKLISLAVCYQDGVKKEEVRWRLPPPLPASRNPAARSVSRRGAPASQLQPAPSATGTGSTTASPRQALGMRQGGVADSAIILLDARLRVAAGMVEAAMRGGQAAAGVPPRLVVTAGGCRARRSCRCTSRRTGWWNCRRPWRRCPTSSAPATSWPVGCPLSTVVPLYSHAMLQSMLPQQQLACHLRCHRVTSYRYTMRTKSSDICYCSAPQSCMCLTWQCSSAAN